MIGYPAKFPNRPTSKLNWIHQSDTDKNSKQEGQQLQRCADVIEVRLLALNGYKNLIKPRQLQVGVRPNIGAQCLLEDRDAATR